MTFFARAWRSLGCMGLVKHEIRVVDDEPLRRDFGGFPLPYWRKWGSMWRKCWKQVAIHPSQSPWCNAVVLVSKKDGGLCFCIDFHKLNARTKKDSYPLPHIQKAIEESCGCWIFFLPGPESRFWQITMDKSIKAVYCLHGGKPRILLVWMNALWVVQSPHNLLEANAELA